LVHDRKNEQENKIDEGFTVKSKRYMWFFFSILGGLVVGMIYGWYIRPSRASNLDLNALRSDYQADYVLMVAETYRTVEEMPLATSHLLQLGKGTPIQLVQDAIITAQGLGYSQQDMQLLANLANSLQQGAPALESGGVE